MRQLDLFTSLFDTTTTEPKSAERLPLSKEEKTAAIVKDNSQSLPNILVNEKQDADDITDLNKTASVETVLEEEAFTNTEPEEKETTLEDNFSIVTDEKSEIVSEQLQKIEPVTEAASGMVKLVVKQKKETALRGNGTVIFDDGKITVKLKSKTPVLSPSLSENRVKAKKEPQKRGRKSLQEIEAEAELIEIPEDEVLFQKQYYPISEVAGWFKVNTSLIRFWENEFDVLKPRKNRKGDRLFRPEDVKNLQLIYQLLRQRKYTIEGAKEYIKTNSKKADIQLQLTTTLQKFKSFLLDLKANLQS